MNSSSVTSAEIRSFVRSSIANGITTWTTRGIFLSSSRIREESAIRKESASFSVFSPVHMIDLENLEDTSLLLKSERLFVSNVPCLGFYFAER